ncbi:putative disease resistance protein RGA3 [Hibiscus syriacus]|uniref:putative disease resistance protein RGA3 n=1 Tax=Hibiscus syriacus TaxID=106335 RepID=UPI001921BAF9|nr:putative disease resistance protein RGA3 [Hibiscus syriacus]
MMPRRSSGRVKLSGIGSQSSNNQPTISKICSVVSKQKFGALETRYPRSIPLRTHFCFTYLWHIDLRLQERNWMPLPGRKASSTCECVGETEFERNEDRETSSPVKEWEVFGRADDKGKIVSMIFNDANHHDGLYVYAICGMGGLGKITIAQLVCNDENVAKAFDLRIWVCVSYDFDVKRLTKAIVESIEGGSCDILELDPLQLCLVEKLARRRFLLVLDYVWNEYHDKWDRLHEALRYGG